MTSFPSVVISGSGLWTPPYSITNEELVNVLNENADRFNHANADAIERGEVAPMAKSDAAFIEKASGIRERYVYEKDGILDINRMRPNIPARAENEMSQQAEMAVAAARAALDDANRNATDIDAVIVSCAYTQRAYPAIAIEVQEALGIEGFGFDMLVACSAATFALQRAYEMVRSGTARSVLVINPELVTPQLNYADRDSHFIFGDVATAMVVENEDQVAAKQYFRVLDTKAVTKYSNNIRSNFGHLSRAADIDAFAPANLFHQEGRKVFKEVCPMAAEHMSSQLAALDIDNQTVKRWWLHQANINMNILIAKKLLGRTATEEEAPIVLDRFGNTASAGSIIAFTLYHKDFANGDIGVICSFGAGYSIGSLVIECVQG
ncbi:beta-ketoacyl-ACP synthase III [Reinekea blandensis]|uniref:3-oxoacyl-(Acyl carrier protein) synthase n=1 Tax=Reinekea blandensis MED297 TaxID=314283 RepID=A4BBK8_9GAMM|nr:beta-ketoacyl-ACP synthase III [Reinekea blandensis]EAR10343.1 3-oxoacyl-(acyl carrier protein) synthase [Reinekea sp. MED297] [Reinekea blandensis MED297]